MPPKTTESQSCQCPHVEKCAFFIENRENLPGLCEKLKEEYCLKDNTHCARLRLRNAIGPEAIPILMTPHQHEWADQILSDAGKSPSKYPR